MKCTNSPEENLVGLDEIVDKYDADDWVYQELRKELEAKGWGERSFAVCVDHFMNSKGIGRSAIHLNGEFIAWMPEVPAYKDWLDEKKRRLLITDKDDYEKIIKCLKKTITIQDETILLLQQESLFLKNVDDLKKRMNTLEKQFREMKLQKK